MKICLSALAALGSVLLATTVNATVFYIDQFQITKNGNSSWFNDPFNDGLVPPSSESLFPDGTQASYFTIPDPMPGPEQSGKLALDTAQGEPTTSAVTGNQILMQRARLATNTSNDPADLDRGLKTDDTFTVTGVYDLIQPEIRQERYGIRLTDFKTDNLDPNDNVQLGVVLSTQGDWMVGFRQADFDAGKFNLLDSRNLSNITNISIFDQIALMLSKSNDASNEITASFELIDLQNTSNNLLIGLNGNPTIFNGELWTRAGFTAFQVVPVPAALPLFGSALGLMSFLGWRRMTKAA
jgi:hypothetical protein